MLFIMTFQKIVWKQKVWDPDRMKYGASSILSLCPPEVLDSLCWDTFYPQGGQRCRCPELWLTGKSWLNLVLNLSFI